jgi:hypothetical protein
MHFKISSRDSFQLPTIHIQKDVDIERKQLRCDMVHNCKNKIYIRKMSKNQTQFLLDDLLAEN